MRGLSRAQRLRIMVLFLAFEAGTPLVGLALGAPLAGLIGGMARFMVPVALAYVFPVVRRHVAVANGIARVALIAAAGVLHVVG